MITGEGHRDFHQSLSILYHMKTQLYPGLAGTIGYVLDTVAAPTAAREEKLLPLVNYLCNHPDSRRLLFVCTHNSRRSHLAQCWAAAASVYYDVAGVEVYSGGTEVTALHLHTIDALLESLFEVRVKEEHASNSHYEILLGGHLPPVTGFSKTIDSPINPSSDFCAVMVCAEADEGCPFVAGAKERVSLPYTDPKYSDRQPDRRKVYHKTSLEIAREMLWVFEKVA